MRLAVFIGRFQPFHNGHKSIIQHALEKFDRVLVLVGSSYSSRSIRNPFSFDERAVMIRNAFDLSAEIEIEPLEDIMYNNVQWVTNVQEIVNDYAKAYDATSIHLIGHKKDQTSYYLDMFPQWEFVNANDYHGLSSTDIRNWYFGAGIEHYAPFNEKILKTIPNSIKSFLIDFYHTSNYAPLAFEFEYIKNYKEAWSKAPYPPIFTTVDACVVCLGHILLIKRGHAPGVGLWALPGGFLNQHEFIEDAMIRELKEETRLKVPAAVLKGSIEAKEVFDDPNRSVRGRTITHAHLINLENEKILPKVKGSDDADEAFWVPLSSIKREQFFEDHYDIILNLTRRL